MRKLLTRLPLENNGKIYPCLIIHWTEYEDQLGWHGIAQLCNEEHQLVDEEHTISVRQTLPLGAISITFDECAGGSWKFASFEGTRLDERDLQWATAWASLVLENKRYHMKIGL
jgi:hypothetical protein